MVLIHLQFLRSDISDTISGGLTMGTQNALVASNYGHGVFGLYNASKMQHVWSMGTAYNLPADGSGGGDMYGLAFTHTNHGGQSKAGLSHQLLVMHNGVTQSAMGAGFWTSGTITTTSHGTSANWNTAYGWGNHASAGYLTSHQSLSGKQNTLSAGTRHAIQYIDGYGAVSYDKLRVWDSSAYAIGMYNAQTFGWLNDYAMTFQMNNDSDRGFVWRHDGMAASDGAMSLTTGGNLSVKNAISIGGSTTYYMHNGSWGWRHQTPYGYIEFGPANTSHAHIYTDRPNFYYNKAILILGNNVLDAGNYSSYALPLSGGVLTGSLTGTDIYHTNWIRNHSNNNGHYWSNTGWHLYPQDTTKFYMKIRKYRCCRTEFIR